MTIGQLRVGDQDASYLYEYSTVEMFLSLAGRDTENGQNVSQYGLNRVSRRCSYGVDPPQVEFLCPSRFVLIDQGHVSLSENQISCLQLGLQTYLCHLGRIHSLYINHISHLTRRQYLIKQLSPERLTFSISSRLSPPPCLDLGVSILPSTTTCATWILCGPNSRARDCDNARRANIPGAMAEKTAPPRRAMVAPVKIKVPLAPVFSVSSVVSSGVFERKMGMRT